MAHYDLGINNWDDFADLTPPQFRELCKRRNIRIKYSRYEAGMVASAVYNVNRHSDDSPIVTAFDFVRDDESSRKKERLQKAKRFCSKAIGNMPVGTSREKLMEIRGKAIKDLQAEGYKDAEQIMNECWPHLRAEKE